MARHDEVAVLRYLTGNIILDCCIIENYMPPYAQPEKHNPMVVVYSRKFQVFLRKSRKEVYWNAFGDDFGTIEEARIALQQAPPPHPDLDE